MKRIGIALAVFAALAVVVVGTLYYVAGTPWYSLYVIQKSIREGDRDTFYRHFDVTKVVSHAVDRAVGGIPAGPQIVSQKATEMLIPASDAIIREQIDARFDDPGSAPAAWMKYDSARYQNNFVFVKLADPKDASKSTTVTLERMPDRQWKVVDLDLTKIGVDYTLQAARQRAEELLPPEMPAKRRPNLQGIVPP